jgi:pimeloyl-ACP methyl ester carboxylesterase
VRLAVIVLAAAALALPASSTGTPPWLEVVEDCLTPAEQKLVVGFRASDGTRLAGVLSGRGTTGVVLVHGSRSSFCEWLGYLHQLERSHRVLAIDLRGTASSYPSPVPKNVARYELDVGAAAGVLRRSGASRVYVVGSSLGAGVAVIAAATVKPPLAGAVALSAPAFTGGSYDTVGSARRARIPLLFVAARGDRFFARDATLLYRTARTPRKQLVIVSGGAHGSGLLEVARPAAAVRAFLARR